MRELDFHIDEPILHDAVIEKKMDFKAILAASSKSAQSATLNLSSIWTLAIIFGGAVILTLSGLNHQFMEPSQKQTIHQDLIANNQVSIDDENAFVIAPVLIDSVVHVSEEDFLDPPRQEEKLVEALPRVQVDFKKKSSIQSKPRNLKLESIELPGAKKIESEKAAIIVEEAVQIPKGFPISVDIKTYADLKRCEFYYFELDKAKRDEAVLRAEDWESGDLIFHPEKNKYNLILSKGSRKKQVVVRLIKGNMKLRQAKFWDRKR